MNTFESLHDSRARRRVPRWISTSLTSLLRLLRFSLFSFLAILEPIIAMALSLASVLLLAIAGLYALAGTPGVPIQTLLMSSGLCAFGLGVYYVALRWLNPRQHG